MSISRRSYIGYGRRRRRSENREIEADAGKHFADVLKKATEGFGVMPEQVDGDGSYHLRQPRPLSAATNSGAGNHLIVPIDRCQESLHNMGGIGTDLVSGLLSCGMQVFCSPRVNHAPDTYSVRLNAVKPQCCPEFRIGRTL